MKFVVFLLFILSIQSCTKYNNNCACMLEYDQELDYEPLAVDYEINYPSNYDGGIQQWIEGAYYLKVRDDNQVRMHYLFDIGNWLAPFGPELNDSVPIFALNLKNQFIQLDHEMVFCRDGEEFAKLYHNDKDSMTTQLYLKFDGIFRKSMTTNLNREDFDEVIDIHRSILIP